MRILGISAFYHDSAAALVEDGRIVAAAQEERFTRKKHDPSFPMHAIGYCLEATGARLSDIDHVVFYDKPFLKFERLLETYIAMAPAGFRSFQMAIPLWLKEKLFQKSLLRKKLGEFDEEFDGARLLFTEHHLSHAASAFYPSSFDMDVAASIQAVLDEAVLRLTRSLASKTGARNLCLAGGVALNCVANGKVLRDGKFDRIWIQPAAGDAGGAVGAAFAAYHQFR